MSFVTNNAGMQQLSFLDPYNTLTEREKNHNRSEETEAKIRTVLRDAGTLKGLCGSEYDESSILRRKYQIDLMPIREYIKSKLLFGCKIGALNFIKILLKDVSFYEYNHKNKWA